MTNSKVASLKWFLLKIKTICIKYEGTLFLLLFQTTAQIHLSLALGFLESLQIQSIKLILLRGIFQRRIKASGAILRVDCCVYRSIITIFKAAAQVGSYCKDNHRYHWQKYIIGKRAQRPTAKSWTASKKARHQHHNLLAVWWAFLLLEDSIFDGVDVVKSLEMNDKKGKMKIFMCDKYLFTIPYL